MSRQSARPAERPLSAAGWLYPAVLLVIFLAPSQIAYAVRPTEGPFLGLADGLAGLVCLLALLVVIISGSWSRLTYPPLAVWALVIVAALSVSQAVHPLGAVVETVQSALYLVAAYMLFVNVLRSRRRVQYALGVLTLATTVMVVWGAVQYFQQADPLQVRAGFTNCNTYSAFLALVLPLLLAGALYTRRTGWRLWWIAVVAVGLLTLLSGPLIWVTILALGLVAFSRRGLPHWAVWGALAVFIALMPVVFKRNYQAAVVELLNPYETEIIKLPGGGEGTSEFSRSVVKKRWLEWQPALRMLSDNFILGVGAGNYQANIGQYYGELPNVRKSQADTNNLYLVVAGSMGFLGLIALVGVFTHFWRRAAILKLLAEDNLERALAAGLPACMFALVVGNLFTAMFVRGIGIVIALLFAFIQLAASQRLGGEEESERGRAEEG